MRRPVFGRSVYNSERSAGARGRAREELKTVLPGAATRERFLKGGGEKRFGVAAGCHAVLVPPTRQLAVGAGFRRPEHVQDLSPVRAD